MLDTAKNRMWREYGQRVGIRRFIDAFDAAAVAPSRTPQRHDDVALYLLNHRLQCNLY
jgi:hypothetical protein